MITRRQQLQKLVHQRGRAYTRNLRKIQELAYQLPLGRSVGFQQTVLYQLVRRKMASVCWNHRLGCFGSKASSLPGMCGPDILMGLDVTVVVVVSIGEPIFVVEN